MSRNTAMSAALSTRARTRLALGLCAALGLGIAASVRADTIVVANCNDSGAGSLRAAVASAHNDDTIDLSQLSCSTITLSTGEISTNVQSLLITAIPLVAKPEWQILAAPYAASVPRVVIDAGGHSRVLNATATSGYAAGTIALIGLDMRNGSVAGGNGGCVYAATDTLALYYSTVSGCHAVTTFSSGSGVGGTGGGVAARRTLTLDHSTLADNTCTNIGGGAYAGSVSMHSSTVRDNAAIEIENGQFYGGEGGGLFIGSPAAPSLIAYSAIFGNYAKMGGGLLAFGWPGGVLNITASTVSGNRAVLGAGGIAVTGAASHIFALYNSTVAFNSTLYRHVAGVEVTGDTRIVSSVVANNIAYTFYEPSSYSSDLGAYDSSSTTLSGSHDIIITSTLPMPADTISIDPRLAALADYGGPTLTHALLPGSPAIDHGANPLALRCDQRYFATDCYPRSVGTSTDIGAFESSAQRDAIFADGFE